MNRNMSLCIASLAFGILSISTPATAQEYNCFKVKPGASSTFFPPFVSVESGSSTSGVPTATCSLGKLASICIPAAINGDATNVAAGTTCCFKSKCDPKAASSDVHSLTLQGPSSGGPTEVTLVKQSQLCLPCTAP